MAVGRQPAFIVRSGSAGVVTPPPTPDVALNFMGPSLPSGWAVSRTSGTATDLLFTDPSSRTITDYAINTPRFRSEGLLIEPTRSNFLPNSNAPTGVTQNAVAALGVRSYLLWFHGTGTVTLNGITAVSPQFGVPVTQAMCPYVVTTTTGGTFSATPSGTITRWQFEQADNAPWPGAPTSFLKTTNALVTRGNEACYLDPAPWINVGAGTWCIEFQLTSIWSAQPMILNVYSPDGTTDRETIFSLPPLVTGTASPGAFRGNTLPLPANLGGTDTPYLFSAGQVLRACYVAGPNRRVLMVNGSNPVPNITTLPRPTSLTKVGLLSTPPGTSGGSSYGFLRQMFYWNRELNLPQAQLVSKTTWSP